MFCTNCGELLEEDFLFCLNCGQKIDLLQGETDELVTDASTEANGDFAKKEVLNANDNNAKPIRVVVKKPKSETISVDETKVDFCLNCGEPLEPDYQFCINCNYPVGGNQEKNRIVYDLIPEFNNDSSERTDELKPDLNPIPEKNKRVKNFVIAILLLLAILLGVAIYFANQGKYLDFLPSLNKSSQTIEKTSSAEKSEPTTKPESSDPSKITIKKTDDGWVAFQGDERATTYTGFAENEYGTWLIRNGKVDFGENGVIKNQQDWVKVTGGKLDGSYTGIASNEYGTWYLENGKVNFNYSGQTIFDGTTYTINNGKVQ